MKSNGEGPKLTNKVNRLTRQLTRLRIEQEIVERQLILAQDELEYKRVSTSNDEVETTFEYHQNYSTTNIQSKGETNVARERKLKTVVQRYKRELKYQSGEVPAIGDEVRIINPKPGQRNKGVIYGYCTDGKVKIRTDQGVTITRLPKNLRYTIYETKYVSE